jgi:hypothetical protein
MPRTQIAIQPHAGRNSEAVYIASQGDASSSTTERLLKDVLKNGTDLGNAPALTGRVIETLRAVSNGRPLLVSVIPFAGYKRTIRVITYGQEVEVKTERGIFETPEVKTYSVEEYVNPKPKGLTLADLNEDALLRIGFNHPQHALNAVKKDARENLAHSKYANVESYDMVPLIEVENAAKRRGNIG